MSKSDNITKQEADNIKNSIIHIEAGDHLITDEAKRHKLALMLVCSFVLMISYYHDAKVGSLFGIIKFSQGHEICVLELIPFAILVMIYHAILYTYHFKEANNAWKNKKLKSFRENKITEFNKLTSNIDRARHLSLNREVEKPIKKIHSELSNTLQHLKESANYFESESKSGPISKHFDSTISELRKTAWSISQKLNYEDGFNHKQEILRLCYDVRNQCEIIDYELDKKEWYENRVSKLKVSHQLIERLIINFERFHIENYNYYLEQNFDRELSFNHHVKQSTKEQNKIYEVLKSTSFVNKEATYIYVVIPFFYFTISLISSSTVYFINL